MGTERPSGTATPTPAAGPDGLRAVPTRELLNRVARTARELARMEVELAKAELRADLHTELRLAGGLGVAALCAIFTAQLLLTAAVLALMEAGILPGWAAALVVAALVLVIGAAAGLWGWARRVREPLATTRRSLQETARWPKRQTA